MGKGDLAKGPVEGLEKAQERYSIHMLFWEGISPAPILYRDLEGRAYVEQAWTGLNR